MMAILSSRTNVRATAILTSRSDVRAVPFCSWLKDLVPSMSDVSVEIFHHYDRIGSYKIKCESKPFHHCDRMCSCLDMSLPSVWGCVPLDGIVPF